ncbi:hypothetical protein [Actinomadura sp. WMMA1423]|uniref:hypothetical protein n=1 Tax=Actinomadura sp. WMMA1423 TaxID=2591108 RepID=UPI001147A498|nr:hypothetical protein [Actinomadura sp. WMMA1423]
MATDLHVAFWCTINGRRHVPGDEVTVEDDDQAAMLIQDGLCRRADTHTPGEEGSAGGAAEPDGHPDTDRGGALVVKPDRSAPKGAWVDYAIRQGMPENEARAASKPALIASYDPDPDPDPGAALGGPQ